MRIERKNNGTQKKPIWEPDISDELKEKIKSIKLVNNEYYEAELTGEEKLRAEFDQKLTERVNEIANVIESELRGKELADEIRGLNK